MDLDVRRMVDQVLQSDVHPLTRVKSLQVEMVRQYAAMYRELMRSAAGTGEADRHWHSA